MNTALVCGLIILIVLAVLLLAGVPIAVALGISSICAILPIMETSVAVLTGAQRIFSGISVFSLLAIPFFILAGNLMNKGYRSSETFTAKENWNFFLQALPCLLLIIIVIGGIIGGIFTATEGSVVAVVYSLLLSLFGYESIKIKDLPQILKDSAEMTGIIIFLIGVSSIMSWVMAFTNIPELVSTGLLSVSNNRYVILLMINVILLVVGTFMDMTPACLIFTPIFLPVCQALGMNTVHFGIMMIFNLCIGTITPPVGTTLFVGVKVGGVKIETVIRQLLIYFAAIFAVLLLVTYVPQISLFLPGLMGYV